jgi:Trm5-related predicted tRNA methylase
VGNYGLSACSVFLEGRVIIDPLLADQRPELLDENGSIAMKIWTEKARAHRKAPITGLAAAMLMASMGVVAAQEHYPPTRDLYSRYGLYEYRSVAPSRWDRLRFHRSGTRGRMGLGADPAHPEGPSNVSD